MVIDMNVLPTFIEELGSSEEQLEYCRQQTGLYKTGEESVASLRTLAAASGIDMLCLMPLDLSTVSGGYLGTNEQVAKLVEDNPDFFIGFASVDPAREDALDVVERAFDELDLAGLMLHPAQQRFSPDDESLFPIYEACEAHDKPIVFQAGMSARPRLSSSNSHPMLFEDVALAFPGLRMCLQHFGWPWTREVAMIMLKCKNVYTDLSCLYFDNAPEFYGHIFSQELGEHWIDRSLRHQVMFASEEPRLEMRRMAEAIRAMPWRDSTKAMVMGDNALEFLKGGPHYD